MFTAIARNATRRSEAIVATSGVGTYIRDGSVALRLRRLHGSLHAEQQSQALDLLCTQLIGVFVGALRLPAATSLPIAHRLPEGHDWEGCHWG